MVITIVENRQSQYVIAVPVNATIVEKTGAQELQDYLFKATGAFLPILSEKNVNSKAFYIGQTAYAEAAGIRGTEKENWKIQVLDGNVVLTGGTNGGERGNIYAVYHFLEDVVGVRWWSAAEEDVPELSALVLDADLSLEGTPKFSFRKIFIHECHAPDFTFYGRTRLNLLDLEELKEGPADETVRRAGGAPEMGGPHQAHTVNLYISPKEYFEEHPEWFAWDETSGTHVPYGHVCFTNEEMFREMLRKILALIGESIAKAEREGTEPPCFYSVSLADTDLGFCECPRCREVIERSGRTGYLLQFVNKIAREVATVYPEAKIDTLVYDVYMEPPKDDTLPEKNMVIRMAHMDNDVNHGIHARGNKYYLQRLKTWAEICRKAGCEFYLWEYIFSHFLAFPFVQAHRLGDTLKTFYDYGIKGVMIENEMMHNDMWELTQYVLVHLCEDPEADVEALIADFCNRFYKQAAPYVMEYLECLRTASEKYDISLCSVRDDIRFNYIDADAAIGSKAALEKAMEAVQGDEVLEFRVAWLQRALYNTLILKYFDLKNMARREGKIFEADREAMRKHVITMLKKFKVRSRERKYNDPPVWFDNEIQFFENMIFEEEEEIAPLPAELSDVNPGDVFQFYFKDTVRNAIAHWGAGTGFSVEKDPDSVVSQVMKLSYDQSDDPNRSRTFVSGKDDIRKKMLDIYIRQEETVTSPPQYYREQLQQDGYHLYHIGTVRNIPDYADSRLFLFGFNHSWVNLSGIAVTFPMENCDVYLSMKFTGSIYGGTEQEENAIYVDRLIVIRK